MRLDRFLTRSTNRSCDEIAAQIASGAIAVNGRVTTDGKLKVDRFSRIEAGGEVLQDCEAIYLMLHKPAGYLSATSDPQHLTVMDLIDHPDKATLHLAGRLDKASTGLVLLTNDGRWSKRITEPDRNVTKVYRVTSREPILPEYEKIFAEGIYFAYEDLTTKPALLLTQGSNQALITISEGRYHQVKRMFHAVGNQVITLHRERVGHIILDLPEGHSRNLTPDEIQGFS